LLLLQLADEFQEPVLGFAHRDELSDFGHHTRHYSIMQYHQK
jgi:hypothetical protein